MSQPINIGIAWLPHGRGLQAPAYQTPCSAGMDLLAALPEGAPLVLQPMERALCPCGFVMALPAGYEAQIRPRSGLALKHGLSVPNAPGTIDADYRGEVKVLLINLGSEPISLTRGMRIAQMVIARHETGVWQEAADPAHLPASDRGAGGFGSTGH
jgi:dUTP pyrophosphatase